MISAIELERCVASTSILGIVVSDLCHEKKPCPIILLKVDKSSEVSFHGTILPLSLAIYLRVEGDGESPLDIEEII